MSMSEDAGSRYLGRPAKVMHPRTVFEWSLLMAVTRLCRTHRLIFHCKNLPVFCPFSPPAVNVGKRREIGVAIVTCGEEPSDAAALNVTGVEGRQELGDSYECAHGSNETLQTHAAKHGQTRTMHTEHHSVVPLSWRQVAERHLPGIFPVQLHF